MFFHILHSFSLFFFSSLVCSLSMTRHLLNSFIELIVTVWAISRRYNFAFWMFVPEWFISSTKRKLNMRLFENMSCWLNISKIFFFNSFVISFCLKATYWLKLLTKTLFIMKHRSKSELLMTLIWITEYDDTIVLAKKTVISN